MSKLLIVKGSVRPNSVNRVIVDAIKKDLETCADVEVRVADLKELNLPFFDAPTTPSSEAYEIPYESVERWSEMVDEADGVIFAVPEYNHSMSAVQKNAIDWLYKEWKDKPVAFVGYGWHAGNNSLAQFKIIGSVVKWSLREPTTGLQFKKELELDGSFIDEAAIQSSIRATLDGLLGSL